MNRASILLWRPARRRHLEFGKLKAGRDRASDERPVARRSCCLPRVRRDDSLWALAGDKIVAQLNHLVAPVCCDFKFERRAGVKVPDFGGIDAVPLRAFPAREQKINRGRRGTAAIDLAYIAEDLAEMSTLRMRLQIQQSDDLGGAEIWRAQGSSELILALANLGKDFPRRTAGKADRLGHIRQVGA
jgi:hypothetical protein